jgi:hypothetical protein
LLEEIGTYFLPSVDGGNGGPKGALRGLEPMRAVYL